MDTKDIKELMNQASKMDATLINLKEAFAALCKIIVDMESGINEVRRVGEEYKIKKVKGDSYET